MSARPGRAELVVFGLVLLLAPGLAGWAAWRGGAPVAARVTWTAGGLLALAYATVPALRRPLHAAWMGGLRPLERGTSHALLGLIFFGVVTPLGLLMRLRGRDPLARRLARGPGSYWVRHDPGGDPARYLRQS